MQGVQDIFLWANQLEEFKNDLEVELFLFNKKYTPYKVRYNQDIKIQIQALFLSDIVSFITLGAGTGVSVVSAERIDSVENVILQTNLDKIENAQTVFDFIEHHYQELEEFTQADHEFKNIKGIVAKFSYQEQFFYSVKLLPPSMSVSGALAWELSNSKIKTFQPEVGFRVPSDNQTLIINQDIFIFNLAKFERLFGHSFKKQLIADQKISEIENKFRLSLADGFDLRSLIKDNPRLINKLQKLEIGDITQQQVIDYCDEMQLELMTDDSGAIIIMDLRDLSIFINLINEDYMVSQITGQRYEVKNKKILDDPEGEPPRSGVK